MFKFFKKLFKTNPRKKGRRLAMVAMLSFNSQTDASRFRSIRNLLRNRIEERALISQSMIQEFTAHLAKEMKVSPLLFSMVVSELLVYVDPDEPEGEDDLYLFLQGIVDAISIVYPDNNKF